MNDQQKLDQIFYEWDEMKKSKFKYLSKECYLAVLELTLRLKDFSSASFLLREMDKLKIQISRKLLDSFFDLSLSFKETEKNDVYHKKNFEKPQNKFDLTKKSNYNVNEINTTENQKKDQTKQVTKLKTNCTPYFPKYSNSKHSSNSYMF